MDISKEKFIEWMNKQPEDRTFDYTNSRGCLFASFIKETFNMSQVDVGSFVFTIDRGGDIEIPDWFQTFTSNMLSLSPPFDYKCFQIKHIKHLI